MDVGGDQVGKGSAFYLNDFAGKLNEGVTARMLPSPTQGSNSCSDRE